MKTLVLQGEQNDGALDHDGRQVPRNRIRNARSDAHSRHSIQRELDAA